MPALFRPRANTIVRLAAAAAVLMPVLVLLFLMLVVRSPMSRHPNEPLEQPIPFDHRHHAGDEGIDCRYCHWSVEDSSTAGIPATEVCMGCHAQIWNRSDTTAPIRRSFFDGTPIPWVRVHRLPGYVYFDHSIHVNKGIGCVSCHGRVEQMSTVVRVAPLTMQWCLECHRNPVEHLRPREEVASTLYRLPEEQEARRALQVSLARAYDVQPRTSCTTCHR